MSDTARIRLNIISKEIELEGSEAFISKYDDIIEEIIENIKANSKDIGDFPQANIIDESSSVKPNALVNGFGKIGIPDSFGEFYSRFSRDIKVVDKLLIAGYFAQEKSSDGLFTPKEAADLLIEQNVPISNANAFINSSVRTNKLFKHSGKYKLSERGISEVIDMLNTK